MFLGLRVKICTNNRELILRFKENKRKLTDRLEYNNKM